MEKPKFNLQKPEVQKSAEVKSIPNSSTPEEHATPLVKPNVTSAKDEERIMQIRKELGLNKSTHESSEISRELINQIIESENIRYKSSEARERAKKIDTDFPPSLIEKTINKYKSQEKNIDYIGHEPNIFIGDWLDSGAGGFYQKQPPLVSRKKDFIEVTNKATSSQISQILPHEYNHMVTQGHSNFSEKYRAYIRDIFLNDEDLKNLGESNKILLHEPYPGAGPVYRYLTTPGEINAYIGTNLRNDLLRKGIIKNFYDEVDENVLDLGLTVKDSNCNRSETPIYNIYSMMVKDKRRLVEWLNRYAI